LTLITTTTTTTTTKVLLSFGPPAQSRAREYKAKQSVNGCIDASFSDHGVLEEDRISPVMSDRQALEQECCLPRVHCVVVIRLLISCVISVAMSTLW